MPESERNMQEKMVTFIYLFVEKLAVFLSVAWDITSPLLLNSGPAFPSFKSELLFV